MFIKDIKNAFSYWVNGTTIVWDNSFHFRHNILEKI